MGKDINIYPMATPPKNMLFKWKEMYKKTNPIDPKA